MAQVKEYQALISNEETLPLLVELLHSPSQAAQLGGLHALNELLAGCMHNP